MAVLLLLFADPVCPLPTGRLIIFFQFFQPSTCSLLHCMISRSNALCESLIFLFASPSIVSTNTLSLLASLSSQHTSHANELPFGESGRWDINEPGFSVDICGLILGCVVCGAWMLLQRGLQHNSCTDFIQLYTSSSSVGFLRKRSPMSSRTYPGVVLRLTWSSKNLLISANSRFLRSDVLS